MRQLQKPEIDRTADLVSVLDSPLRLQILLLLDGSPHVVHQLVDKLGKSQPLVSQHLRVLKKFDLVDSSRAGREVVYTLARPEVIDIIYELADIATGTTATATVQIDDLAARRDSKQKSPEGDEEAADSQKDSQEDFARAGSAPIIDPQSSVRPMRDPELFPVFHRPSCE